MPCRLGVYGMPKFGMTFHFEQRPYFNHKEMEITGYQEAGNTLFHALLIVRPSAIQILRGGDLKYVHTFFDTPPFRGWSLIPPSLECWL